MASMRKRRKGNPHLPLHRRNWDSLKPHQKATRRIALDVLAEARETVKPLYKIAKEKATSIKTVIKHTNAFRKTKGKWIAKKTDIIPRPAMRMNEDGKEVWIKTKNSKDASLIGHYQSRVREFLNSGSKDLLKTFDGISVKDSNGADHYFETDPQKIIDIHERREDYEFYEVYSP